TRLAHAEERTRNQIDALGRLVRRELELEHAPNLTQARHMRMGATEFVAELRRTDAQSQIQDEGARRSEHSERPEREEGPRPVHGVTSPLSARSASRRATRSLALRARGFSACS